jgi:hypothetical protein
MKNYKYIILLLSFGQANLIYAQELDKSGQELMLQLIKERGMPGSCLRELRLLEEDLSLTDLRWADLSKGVFLNVNLKGSDLREAILQEVNFSGSILIGAKFKGADLEGAKNLHKAIYKKCARLPFSWLPWWEYDKDTLDLEQITQTLVTGYTVCQSSYSNEELNLLKKFKLYSA